MDTDRRWRVLAAVLVAVSALALVSAVRPSDDDTVADKGAFVFLVALLILALLVWSLAEGGHGWMKAVGRGVGIGLILALVIYLWPPEIEGAGDYQFRTLIVLALSAALFALVGDRWGRPGTHAFGAALGVTIPPLVFIALLSIACAGKDECLG